MNKLNDLKRVLLSTAASRIGGHLLPAADSVAQDGIRVRRAIGTLVKSGLASEVPVDDPKMSWRAADDQNIGATITDAGRQAIGTAEPDSAVQEDVAVVGAPDKQSSAPRAGSKQAMVIDLLQREAGASLAELVEATGWLPHTTRAALTGLRKRGFAVTTAKIQGVTRYSISGETNG